MKYEIDYEGLKAYLRTLKHSDFQENYRFDTDRPMKDGVSIVSIERFKKDISQIPKDQIIHYGMPFLVDIIGNDLSIVVLSKRKYKMPDGRITQVKFIRTIIFDCHSVYGTALNGYWIIPERFITKLKK